MFKLKNNTPTPIADKEFRELIAPAVPPRGYRKEPEFLAQFGVILPDRSERPTYDAQTQTIEPDVLPTLVGGEWVLGWTAVTLTADRRLAVASTECQRRIFGVADSTAQMNMASAAAANMLTADQMTAYQSGLQWIAQMRGTWRGLAADTSKDITADANWPTCPTAVVALAAGF